MRSTLIIAGRELSSFFRSVLAYVVLTAWTLIQGASFYITVGFSQSGPSGGSDHPISLFFGQTMMFYMVAMVLVPVLTMRLLADEKRTGSLELLMTAPVTPTEIILGKYLAALVMWLACWAPTLFYVWILRQFGGIDYGVVAACYLGVALTGAYYMAVGLWMSAWADTQISAAMLTFFVLIGFFFAGLLQYIGNDETLHAISRYTGIWQHMGDFAKGIVDTRVLLFDVSLVGLSLYGAVHTLDARRIRR